jgi:hypothetical protein
MVAASAVYVVAAIAVRHFANQPLVAFAALMDIVVSAPLLAFLLLVRRGMAAWSLPLLLAATGLSAGLILIPDASLGPFAVYRHDIWVGLRWLLLGILGARTILAVDSLRHPEDGPQPLTALRVLTGSDLLGRFLLQEARVQSLGLGGWFRKVETRGQVFTQHRTSGLTALLITFGIMLMVETVGLHLVLSLWTPLAAWTATISSLYALVWLAAVYQSVRLRPTVLNGRALTIGAGLRGEVTIDLRQIDKVEPVTAVDHRQPGYLRAAVMMEPNLLLTLKYPAMASDLAGVRTSITRIGLYVDDLTGLQRALNRHRRIVSPLYHPLPLDCPG